MTRTQKREYASTNNCQRNGGCDWCTRSRMHHNLVEMDRADSSLEDYIGTDDDPEDTVLLKVSEVLSETRKAYHLSVITDKKIVCTWFQRNQVELHSDAGVVIVPAWLAEAKGLKGFENVI